MASVLRRVVAFTPVVTVTLLAVGAGVVGYRSSDGSPPAEDRPAATSSGPTDSPTSSPTAYPYVPVPRVTPLHAGTAASGAEATRTWNRAIDKLIHAASARYSWAVYYGADPEPLQSESGGFDLDPLQSNFNRTVTLGNGKTQVVHVRRIGSTTYMQLDHWGGWSGCWLRVTNAQIESQTGVDLSRSLPLPVGILAVTDATITKPSAFWFGAPYRELAAEVNAAEALQFLGISGTVLRKHLDQLLAIKVPITVSLDASGQIHGGGARGTEVAAAIKKAAPGLIKDVVSQLPRVTGAFAVKGLGVPVAVPTPPQKTILPQDATRKDSCEAGDPRA